VSVVVLEPGFFELALEVYAHRLPGSLQHLEDPGRDHTSSIFRDKDQMHRQRKNYMTAGAKIV